MKLRTLQVTAATAAFAAVVALSVAVLTTLPPDTSRAQGAGPSAITVPEISGVAAAYAPLSAGDRLKITFFETVDLAGGKSGERDSQGKLRTFYQRMDLSGEYSVEQDGSISLPLLGRIQVSGRALDDVRATLSVAFARINNQGADVSVTIVDRPPIYVVGPVKKPGTYKYVPGMLVLHAIALAGGLDTGVSGLSNTIEGLREMERLRKTSDRLSRLMVRRARLKAEQAGVSVMPMPAELIKFVDDKSVRGFIQTENAVLRAELAKNRQQEKEIATTISATRNELEALKRKIEQVDVQRNMRNERLSDMQKLKDKGVMTTNNIIIIRTELSDIEARREDCVIAVVQAEARLAQAQEARARLKYETEAALTRSIADVDQEIGDAQSSMPVVEAIASTIGYSGVHSTETISFEIVRQSKNGIESLPASETSSLMPGDVLKVKNSVSSMQIPQTSTELSESEVPSVMMMTQK